MGGQLRIKFPCGWGGKRKGAGRPPKGARPSEKHKRRLRLKPSWPVHITLRVAPDLAKLRKRDMYKAIRQATLTVALREDFRIVHFTLQHGHVHMICEADHRKALSRGVQSFEISAARRINVLKARSGAVFPDRFHERPIKTPTHALHAMRYVLNNWRKHDEDEKSFAREWLVDPYSSGIRFPGWKELDGQLWMWEPSSPEYEPLWTWLPKTWLLRCGWRLAGQISVYDVPG
jgi:REP element-mobilizing transposase RayT